MKNKTKKILITLFLIAYMVMSISAAYAMPLGVNGAEEQDMGATPNEAKRLMGAVITLIQIILTFVFFIYFIVNCLRYLKARGEYNKIQNEEVENKEEAIKKIEAEIVHAKKQIATLILVALVLCAIGGIRVVLRRPKPIMPD